MTENFLCRVNRSVSLVCSNSPPTTSMSLPRAITLAAASNQSCLLSPRSYGSGSSVTPLASPCQSPPLEIPPSGYLEEAKAGLAKAIVKRNTKTSSLSIDVSCEMHNCGVIFSNNIEVLHIFCSYVFLLYEHLQ